MLQHTQQHGGAHSSAVACAQVRAELTSVATAKNQFSALNSPLPMRAAAATKCSAHRQASRIRVQPAGNISAARLLNLPRIVICNGSETGSVRLIYRQFHHLILAADFTYHGNIGLDVMIRNIAVCFRFGANTRKHSRMYI